MIDFHRHTRGGHFGTWLRRFALEFCARFDHVVVLTPDAVATASLFGLADKSFPRNLSLRKLPRAIARHSRLDMLQKLHSLRDSELSAFVMWGKDLKQRHRFHENPLLPWATLMGVSWGTRGHDNAPARAETLLINRFRKDPMFCGFLQPDNFVSGCHKESLWLPFCEPLDPPGEPTCAEMAITKHAAGRPCMGFIGTLSGFRGLDEFLVLAEENPQVAFVAAGPLIRDSVNQHSIDLLGAGRLPNLLLLEGFIQDQRTLSSVVRGVDAVFVDGLRYPVHSSIACRALHFGKALVSPLSNSWACDVVREWGAGVAYRPEVRDLVLRLKEWKGESKDINSLLAAKSLNSAAELSSCFDTIALRLKEKRVKLSV